ncbi:hypothetical protein [Halobacteriovorax sp.]|uniref:hypothetical protein n=1 Tax=Halobacteriovorax sp. TaxID=2020862 RepID=UPI003563E8E7
MKKITLPIFVSLLFPSALLANTKGNLTIGPIVGYERVQKISPTQHTKDRLIYGVRAVYGPPLLSAEAEVTQGKDTESFPDQDLTIKETATSAMVGLRSNFLRTKVLTTYIRAGGHARKSEIETTEAGVTTTREPAVTISPYAGAGLSVNLLNKFRLNLGVTGIFTGKPKGSDREYQTTLGFTVNI